MRMTQTMIQVTVGTPTGPGKSPPIPAKQLGVVAYHRPINSNPKNPANQDDFAWTVTHIPSELAFVSRVRTEKSAKAIIRLLNEKFGQIIARKNFPDNLVKRTATRIRKAVNALAN